MEHEKKLLKQEIHKECLKIAQAKVTHLKDAIAHARASNTDTKSSMGDKYETSREMLQQEITMLEKQLAGAENQLQQLKRITPGENDDIRLGALVQTAQLNLYVSVGLGQIEVNGQPVMVVSPSAPVIKQIFGKSKGDVFLLNNKENKILAVF